MYELIQVTEHCYYIECPSKIGIVRLNDNDVCLIDSGNDKETGRKIRKILDANNWHLTAIYNTHANADHIGGNKYLQGITQCKIYAPPINAAFTRHPILEASFLYGASPPKELRNKFLLAPESNAHELSPEVLPSSLSVIPLPGHFFDMVGYKTADDVLFLADCLLSKDLLDKYRIPFIYDAEQYLATLEQVKTMSAKIFVPAHSAATEDIAPLAQYNIDQVHAVAEQICNICKTPLHFEFILQKLFTDYQLKMNFDQYVLVGSSVRAILSWLKSTGKIETCFENNLLLWKTSSTQS